MRLTRLLVGNDGSPDAAAATAWVKALAGASGAEVMRARVVDRSAVAGANFGEPRADGTVELTGSPVRALMTAAEKFRADLIVVGRRGVGGFESLRLGSVAHQIAEHATLPLAVVPGSFHHAQTGWPFAAIAIGHDGSSAGARALAWVTELAVLSSARVVVVHAVEFGPAFAMAGLDSAYERVRAQTRAAVEAEWTSSLRDGGVEYSTVVEDGGPAGVLLKAAQDQAVDLLVVGRRERGAFPGMAMGSVAHRALGLAHCPVVVIPSSD
jgi:nucleotide-binding universal stress UspA family protein